MKESFTCIVIYDDPLFVKKMEAYIHQIDRLELVATFTEPVKAAGTIIKAKPSLILLDLEMPHMNGYALIDWLFPVMQIKGVRSHFVAISGNNLDDHHPMLDQFLCHISKSTLDCHEDLNEKLLRHLPLSA